MSRFRPIFTLLLIAFVISWATPSLFGQKLKQEDIPDDVIQTLDFEQPGAKVTQWLLNEGTYEATFKNSGMTGTIYIQQDGTFLETHYEVPKNSLPTAVTDYIENNYPLFLIEVSETREAPQVSMYYHIEVRPDQLGAKPSVLTFDDMGRLLTRVDPENFTISEEAQNYANLRSGRSVDSEPEGGSAAAKPAPKPRPAPAAKPRPERPAKAEPQLEISVDDVDRLAPSDIPGNVNKAFTKKVPRPDSPVWYKYNDSYMVVCKVNEVRNELYFSNQGVWQYTYVDITDEQVPQGVLKHLTNYYKGYKFVYGMKELRADKQDKIMVEIIEKENAKTKEITTLVFDKTGKFLKVYEPDNATDAEVEGVDRLATQNLTQVEVGIPTTVVNAFKAKYPKVTGVEYSEDDEGYFLATYFGVRGKEIVVMEGNGNIIETRTAANMGNINPNIAGFVKKNCKGFKISEYYSVRRIIERKNYYRVVLFSKKTGETAALTFTTSGKLVE